MGSDYRPTIVHVVHSLEGGGTERTLVALLQAFDADRFRHAVVSLRNAGALASQLPDHVACYPLGEVGNARLAAWKMSRMIRPLRPAVLHARNTGCWSDALLAGFLLPGVQVVLGFHGLDVGSSFSRRHRLVAKIGGKCGARFASVSYAGASQLHREIGIPEEHIEVLQNGVDLDRFSAADAETRRNVRKSFAFPDSAFVIGNIGSLTPVKGQALLIDAVAQLSRGMELRLLIVGDGPLRAALLRQASNAGVADRVCLAGIRDDVSELLSAMDAYVCSSASEGMSNAVLEAMAGGLPIVATDVGDNPMMIRDGRDGLIIEPHSSTAIVHAIRALVDSPDLRASLSVAARNRAQDFDFERTVQEYERYYGTLIEEKGRRAWAGKRERDARPLPLGYPA